MRNPPRKNTILLAASLLSTAAFAQSGPSADPWSELASQLAQYQEIPNDARPTYIHRVVGRAGNHAIATGYIEGDYNRREQIQEQLFTRFRQTCSSLGGEIRHQGRPGQIRTRKNLTQEGIFFHLGNRHRDSAGMLICDVDRQAIGAMIAIHQVSPHWSSITLLDPAIVVPDAVVEAEQRAASEARQTEHQAWQQFVGEGDMTGCGRILTAKPQIVEIADRRTGQARWVERSELSQPYEGCRF